MPRKKGQGRAKNPERDTLEQLQAQEARFKFRPYLASEEVMELAGVSRRFLTSVAENGICRPFRDETTGTLGWTMGQASIIKDISKLRTFGLKFDEIAGLLAREDEAFGQAVREANMHLLRTDRRSMGRSIQLRATVGAVESIGSRQGYYLRYIPQRWLALIPLPRYREWQHFTFARTSLALASVASHVGWAVCDVGGMLLGAPDASESRRFAFADLAIPPLPAPRADCPPDSGCYFEFGGSCAQGERGDCTTCPRYGEPVTNIDKLRWETHKSMTPCEDPTVMRADLQRPYPCGPWSEDADAPIAARPRLMPHEVRLPLGVTACVIPAGTYLCRQCDWGQQEQMVSEFIGTARVMPHRDLTVTQERERVASLASSMRASGQLDDSPAGAARPGVLEGMSAIADPAQVGWWRPVRDSELSQLVIPTGTALTPESDFSVLCVSIPENGYGATPQIELQLLVDADAAPGPGADRGRSAMGATVSALEGKTAKRTADTVRCKLCGAPLALAQPQHVAVCEQCGKAQGVPFLDSDLKTSQFLSVDGLVRDGNFAAAQRRLKSMSKQFPEEADVFWQAMTCRYGVSYKEDLRTGRLVPDVSRPSGTPVYEDQDYRHALALADWDQWEVYRRQAFAIEEARERELRKDEEAQSLEARVSIGGSATGKADRRDEDPAGPPGECCEDDALERPSIVRDLIDRLRS